MLLEVRADAAKLSRIVPIAVQRIPPVPVFGPRPPPADWKEPMALAERALRAARTEKRPAVIRYHLQRAYRAWALVAEEELADAAGVELRPRRWRRGNRFKIDAVPLLGSTQPIACPTGTASRWIARRARDIAKAIDAENAELVDAYLNTPAAVAPQWFASSDRSAELTVRFDKMIALARRAKACQPQGADFELDEADQDDIDEYHAFIDEAERAAAADERQDEKDERESWSGWVVQALSGGAGAAHSFVRGDTIWHPTSTSTTGHYSVAPGNLLLAEHRRCADLWVTNAEDEHVDEAFLPPGQREELQQLTIQQLRDARFATPANRQRKNIQYVV